jgi:non-ribosomal peptide synthetase component F
MARRNLSREVYGAKSTHPFRLRGFVSLGRPGRSSLRQAMTKANAPQFARGLLVRSALATRLLDRIAPKVTAVLDDALRAASEGARFARGTGFMWQLSTRGLRAMTELLANGTANSASAYRIAAQMHPTKLACVHIASDGSREQLSFAEVDNAIDACANLLSECGVQVGQPVLLCMRNRPDFLIASAAAARLGVAAIAVSYRSTARELAAGPRSRGRDGTRAASCAGTR